VDAAEGDDVGVGFFGFVGEAEGVADEIGDFLDVAGLVVVGEDDGVALFFEAQDFVLDGRGRRRGRRRWEMGDGGGKLAACSTGGGGGVRRGCWG
jgi:hypothetical protein